MGVFRVFDKRYILGRTNAYQEGVTARVFRAFDHLDEEAERLKQDLWDNAMSQPGDGSEDPSAIADHVTDQAVDFLITMEWLRQQTINNATAGLYHLWEKDLKAFLVGTVVKYGGANLKKLLRADFETLVKILDKYEFDFESQPFYRLIADLLLVSNSVKHGPGDSLFELIARRPDLFRKNTLTGEIDPDIENLEITEEKFNDFAQGIVEFWEAFDITLKPVS